MLKFKRPPGRDYVKVICDVCKGEFYQKDVTLVTDKWSSQLGMVVCFPDLDVVNEQIKPNFHREKPISYPELLRSDSISEYVVNENDDRVPGSPRNPLTKVNPINETVDLYWEGPEDTGSSGIVGYRIERALPQLGNPIILVDNTFSGATYYQDISADVSLEYSYRVAAINSFGMGAYSETFLWPNNKKIEEDYVVLSQNINTYITLSQNGFFIRTNQVGRGEVI